MNEKKYILELAKNHLGLIYKLPLKFEKSIPVNKEDGSIVINRALNDAWKSLLEINRLKAENKKLRKMIKEGRG